MTLFIAFAGTGTSCKPWAVRRLPGGNRSAALCSAKYRTGGNGRGVADPRRLRPARKSILTRRLPSITSPAVVGAGIVSIFLPGDGPFLGLSPDPPQCLSPGPSLCFSPGPSRCLSPGPPRCLSPGPPRCLSPGPPRCLSPGPPRCLSPGPPLCFSPSGLAVVIVISPLTGLNHQDHDYPAFFVMFNYISTATTGSQRNSLYRALTSASNSLLPRNSARSGSKNGDD